MRRREGVTSMISPQQEEKLKRLAELIPDPVQEQPEEQNERSRDELGRFTAEEEIPSQSEWVDVKWVRTGENTYTRQEWLLWKDVAFLLGLIGVAILIF